MENFYIALNAVLHMFIMLFIGFAIRKLNILKESFLPSLTACFYGILSVFMFNNIYGSDFGSVFNPKLLIFAVVAVAVSIYAFRGLYVAC
jgi:hypothetical protein